MRQSLSERPVASTPIAVAILLSAALAMAALADQLAGRALMDHVNQMYAAHGKDVDAGLVYGLIYAVAAIDVLLWLLVLRSARAAGRRTVLLTAVAVTVASGLALVLLGSQEYGEPIFPPLWGVLAFLSPVAGALALVRLLRGRAA
jgi:hypothetical protein